MSEQDHTPGPWSVAPHGPNGCPIVGTGMGLMVAMVAHSVNQPEQRGRAIADARLIASAPALIAELDALVVAIYADNPDGLPFNFRAPVAAAERVIAEATGVYP